MTDYKNDPWGKIIADVKTDGKVDAAEVAGLRERVYADGVVDQEEADALFAINDACSGNANDPSWEKLFVEGVGDFVLKDEKSPGAIDADEAQYLYDNILKDGEVDSTEKALLQRIKTEATSIADGPLKMEIASL